MSAPLVPNSVKHNWQPKKAYSGFIHECTLCKAWTANLPLYRNDVCPRRDRRKWKGDRRKASV